MALGQRTKKVSYPETNDGVRRYKHGNEYLIDLRHVNKVYKTAAGDFPALRDVNLQVGRGEFVAVIGKSGSGKSTLINMITGIDRPTSGEVLIGDTAVHTLNEGQMALWRGRNMGIIFQFFQLLPTLTVIENIMLPMDFGNMYTRKERRERAMYLLELVDVAEHAHKLPTAISGGQQQRVAIARAIANDPPILVADEPTGNLDSRTSEVIFELFGKLVSEGKTILMVTHDDDQAKRVSRTVLIADGEIVNEYLARALPALEQGQLVEITRKLQPLRFAPGEPIIQQDTEGDCFYIVTKGEVNVYLTQPDGHEVYVETLTPGQYFGEIALLDDIKRTATVRASRSTEVEVVGMDEATFDEMVDGSEAIKADLARRARERSVQVEEILRQNGSK